MPLFCTVTEGAASKCRTDTKELGDQASVDIKDSCFIRDAVHQIADSDASSEPPGVGQLVCETPSPPTNDKPEDSSGALPTARVVTQADLQDMRGKNVKAVRTRSGDNIEECLLDPTEDDLGGHATLIQHLRQQMKESQDEHMEKLNELVDQRMQEFTGGMRKFTARLVDERLGDCMQEFKNWNVILMGIKTTLDWQMQSIKELKSKRPSSEDAVGDGTCELLNKQTTVIVNELRELRDNVADHRSNVAEQLDSAEGMVARHIASAHESWQIQMTATTAELEALCHRMSSMEDLVDSLRQGKKDVTTLTSFVEMEKRRFAVIAAPELEGIGSPKGKLDYEDTSQKSPIANADELFIENPRNNGVNGSHCPNLVNDETADAAALHHSVQFSGGTGEFHEAIMPTSYAPS